MIPWFEFREMDTKHGRRLRPCFIVTETDSLYKLDNDNIIFWNLAKKKWDAGMTKAALMIDELGLSYAKTKRIPKSYYNRMSDYDTGLWESFTRYIKSLPTMNPQFDIMVREKSVPDSIDDLRLKRLSYDLKEGPCNSFEKLFGELYGPDLEKIMWLIGSVLSGESRMIQKCAVFFGPAGSGKSSILNVISEMFKEYTEYIDVQAITDGKSFAMEPLYANPLVLIQHDTDLSRAKDVTFLNSLVSHEKLSINAKYKKIRAVEPGAILFLATNKPVAIIGENNGLLRRVVDIVPTGKTFDRDSYERLLRGVKKEYPTIAYKCLEVYRRRGHGYYDKYIPELMRKRTDILTNFWDEYGPRYSVGPITLKEIYNDVKNYHSDNGYKSYPPVFEIREQAKNKFCRYDRCRMIDGVNVNNVYEFYGKEKDIQELVFTPFEKRTSSPLKEIFGNCKAQYAKKDGTPAQHWDDVITKLRDIDETNQHYVQLPPNVVVIDFDLKEDNQKSLKYNMMEIVKYPLTYGEISKSGNGIHLYYYCDGPDLPPMISEDIELKTFRGKSAIRRKLTECNNEKIGYIDLNKKESTKMVQQTAFMMRSVILKILEGKIHPHTKPGVDFICKLLRNAQELGLDYDVSDLKMRILEYGKKSTNHSDYCVKELEGLVYKSSSMSYAYDRPPWITEGPTIEPIEKLIFFDCEVFPNLIMFCFANHEDKKVSTLINPTPEELRPFLDKPLVGYNSLNYDDYIIDSVMSGDSPRETYAISEKVMNKNPPRIKRPWSYLDVYDISSKKISLKKYQLELGLYHMESSIPFGEDVRDENIPLLKEYCTNDVLSTIAVFDHIRGDYEGRILIANMSGLELNAKLSSHAARMLFGDDPNYKSEFQYTELSTIFPEYNKKEQTYKGRPVSNGGHITAVPGYYKRVTLLDIKSMHPTSACLLNYFGKYTKRYKDLLDARLLLKKYMGCNSEDKSDIFEKLQSVLDGKITKLLIDGVDIKSLILALKCVLNPIYGLTAAKQGKFVIEANVDNIIAKRGALFMMELEMRLQEMGVSPLSIKTDSIKIENPSSEVLQFINDFGMSYGYEFDEPEFYDEIYILNKGNYIAINKNNGHIEYEFVGGLFGIEAVKKIIMGTTPVIEDYLVYRNVQSGIISLDKTPPLYIGKRGVFCPVHDGWELSVVCENKNKSHLVGSKGYLWDIWSKDIPIERVDQSYFCALANKIKKDMDILKSIKGA